MVEVKRLLEYEQEPEKDPTQDLRQHLHALVDFFITNIAHQSDNRWLDLREVLTPEELAERLKVPKSTIEEMARSGKLPGTFRVGKHWRFDLDLLRTKLPLTKKCIDIYHFFNEISATGGRPRACQHAFPALAMETTQVESGEGGHHGDKAGCASRGEEHQKQE